MDFLGRHLRDDPCGDSPLLRALSAAIRWAERCAATLRGDPWLVHLPSGETRQFPTRKKAYRHAFYQVTYLGGGEVKQQGRAFIIRHPSHPT